MELKRSKFQLTLSLPLESIKVATLELRRASEHCGYPSHYIVLRAVLWELTQTAITGTSNSLSRAGAEPHIRRYPRERKMLIRKDNPHGKKWSG